jgi:uncharacterized protein YjhX (UPF0386 family)
MNQISKVPDIAVLRQRRLDAMRLQEIEGNPLSADQVAMFEMFEREGWSHEQCRAYIFAKIRSMAAE